MNETRTVRRVATRWLVPPIAATVTGFAALIWFKVSLMTNNLEIMDLQGGGIIRPTSVQAANLVFSGWLVCNVARSLALGCVPYSLVLTIVGILRNNTLAIFVGQATFIGALVFGYKATEYSFIITGI